MFKRVTRGWLVRAGIASAVGAVGIALLVTLGGAGRSEASQPMTWTAAGGGVQTVGSSFNVDFNTTNPGAHVWGGFQLEVAYNPGVLTVVNVVAGGLSGCSGASWGNPSNSPTVQTGCAFQSTTTSSPPPSDIVTFKCNSAGTSPIHLVDTIEDPIQGSTFFDENAVYIPTTLTDSSVTCVLPISKSDDTGGTTLAGSTVTYTIQVGNAGPTSSFGHSISDTFPASLTNVTFVSGTPGYNQFGGSCGVAANTLTCTNVAVDKDPTGLTLVLTADVPLSAAGTTICNTATIDSIGTSNNDCFDVAPASLTVTKVADAASYQAGDPISWTITVDSNGPSTAQNVVVTDTPTDGWVATDPLLYNLGDMPSGSQQIIVINGNVNDPNPSDNNCNNSVSVTSGNGASASASAQANCLSKNVRLVKSTDCAVAPTDSGELANLFLGGGPLTVCEWALNVGGDPQGVGAFEFQLKYDNSLFDINIAPTDWLYDVDEDGPDAHDRVPGDAGIGGCSATIITENDIRFGCVSKNPQPLDVANGQCLGPDNQALVDGAVCGNKDNAVIATITVTPKADLIKQLTPGNNNGAVSTLLDEGCEVADIWGHPLSAAIGAPPSGGGNGYDALGREIPLPGITPGGQVKDCADITVTVRILEGDMNTDCTVDVTDDQIEASNYGSNVGTLNYNRWYDLEPALKDGDVDIKDLQKVFGRNGSTCENPVPPQPPLPQPGDP